MGIEYSDFRTGNSTVIQLGNGNDVVVGFPQTDHILMLGGGNKNIKLGNGNDTFLLAGNGVTGTLQRGGGTNILDLGSFASKKKHISVDLKKEVSYLHSTAKLNSVNDLLEMYGITDFFLRPNKQDVVYTVCNAHSIDARGGEDQYNPDIIVISEIYNCTYPLQLTVSAYTRIINRANSSEFIYIVPYSETQGESTVDLQADGGLHRFLFNHTLFDIDRLENIDNTLNIAFINGFKLRITQRDINTTYQFLDQIEIKVVKSNLYAFQSTNRTISEIINHYPRLANYLKLSFIMQLPLMNESIVIGYNKRDVLYNNPHRQSHLMGNGGEDLFVITSGYKILDENKLPIPKVLLYDVDYETSMNTLDLSHIKRQLEKDLGLKVRTRISTIGNDVVIELYRRLTDTVNPLVTVRLKEAFRTSWHERFHIILNHVPMRFNEFDLEPVPLEFGAEDIIIVSPEDVEENTTLVLSQGSGDYRFSRVLNNLLISNAFTNNLTATERYTVSLQAFYQTPKLETLSIQFSDKEIVLKNEMVKIKHAADFTAECEQYNRTTHDIFFNKDIRQENKRPVRHIHAKGVEKKEVSKNRWGIMTSYVLPIVGAIAAAFGAGMGYRHQARNRLRANAVLAVAEPAAMTVPFLAPTVEAKSTKQQEKLGSGSKESYSEQNSRFTADFNNSLMNNTSFAEWFLQVVLGKRSFVARMNKAKQVVANAHNDSMDPLDLIEQSVKKAIGANDFVYAPKSNGISWAAKKNTASFFQASLASTPDNKPEYQLIGLASGT